MGDYLLAEMLDRQPDDIQQMLLRTSLLARVNGELGDLLTGCPGSERILLEVEDTNAFVVSLDADRTWFRYHHLFADLLRLELRRTRPEEVLALHRRAAEWFTQHGQVVDAIRHPGGGRLARGCPAARRPFIQPDAGWADADHPGAAGGLPAGRTPWTRQPPTWPSPKIYVETTPPDRQSLR